MLYTGPLGAGAVGGLVTNTSKQGLKYLTGKQCCFDFISTASDTSIGALTGFIPGVRIPGITAGRGSFNSIFRQMVTKAQNGTASSITGSTAMKMFAGRAVDTAMLPGAGAGAVAGLGAAKLGIGSGDASVCPKKCY